MQSMFNATWIETTDAAVLYQLVQLSPLSTAATTSCDAEQVLSWCAKAGWCYTKVGRPLLGVY